MLCILAKIDDASTARLRALQAMADRFGITYQPLYGHITLAAYTDGEEKDLIAACKAALKSQPPFSVRYRTIEYLAETSILVASPEKTGELPAVRGRITTIHPDWLNSWTRDDIWLPHTTLIHDPQAGLPALVDAIRAAFVPFEATVSRIDFSRASDAGYEVLDAVELVPDMAL